MTKNTYSPSDSSTWHKRFTKEELQWADLKRIGRILIPVILLFFLIVIYPVLYTSAWVNTDNINGALERILFLSKLAIAILLPIIVAGVTVRILFRKSEELVRNFHQVPDDYDHRLAPLIKRRLFGVPPVPAPLKTMLKYPFILLTEAGDLEEDHWIRWFGGPATLVIYDGVAVYLERGNQFSRVLGPGLPMPVLERYERVKAIVDLRPQVKETKVTAWTKDGIEVKLKIRAEVQIASSEEARKKSVVLEEGQDAVHLVYPYDACEVKKLVERTAVKQKSDAKSLFEADWESAAIGTITGKIKAYIAGQTIDELALEDNNSPQLLSFHISDELTNSIKGGLEVAGSQLLSLQVTDFAPTDNAIFDKLVEYWNTQIDTLKVIREGESDAEKIRATQSAHTEAYQEFLNILIDILTEINDGESGIDAGRFTETSILLLTQVLEQSLSDPTLGPFVAQEGLRTLDMLKRQLEI